MAGLVDEAQKVAYESRTFKGLIGQHVAGYGACSGTNVLGGKLADEWESADCGFHRSAL